MSERADGNMSFTWGSRDDVVRHRRAFFKRCELALAEGIALDLEHGTQIKHVTQEDRGCGMQNPEDALGPADALLTHERETALTILTADCLPITLYAPDVCVLALLHAGWRGTGEGLTAKVAHELIGAHNADAAQLIANIGPAITPDSYLLPADLRRKRFADVRWLPYIAERRDGRIAVDLISYTVDQLVDLGVVPDHIEVALLDTAANERFFSHYRDSRTDTAEGRCMTVAMMA